MSTCIQTTTSQPRRYGATGLRHTLLRPAVPRQSRRGHWLRASAVFAVTSALLWGATAGPASATVLSSASRAYGDCTMQAHLDRGSGGVRAIGSVTCTNWHSSVTAHVHLEYYAASYWNPVQQNHWYPLLVAPWGPASGYGVTNLSTSWATGCAYWRAQTQMSLTNTLPTAAQYVSTPYVYLCA